jgi:hypothetical protein
VIARQTVRRQLFWRRTVVRVAPEPPPPPPKPNRSIAARLRADPEATLREIRALVAEEPADLGTREWLRMLVAVFGYGDQALARELFAIFERRTGRWRKGQRQRDWLRPWIEADADSPIAPPTGRAGFAVMDYGHPGIDRGSANIGDHIQTIAALGHLVRHQNVRLHGPDELVALLEDLQRRTRPELRLHDVDADIEILAVHRDASMYQPIPEATWVLCFGWYMHALFNMRYGFPLHRSLRPVFVSFHCNKRGLLTPDAIEYLRRYGPVGCRDWTTVDLLLSVGVPAFFSGCITTTIDTVFPPLATRPPARAPVGYVDVIDAPKDAVEYHHSDRKIRRKPFVDNLNRAVKLLETYRTRHRRLVTSRLHCYLPTRALGVDADFQPERRSDVRFAGLIDLDDRQFAAMRDTLLTKLEPVVGAMLAGHREDEVYGLWRELNAADVEAARKRRERPLELPMPPRVVAARARAAVAGTAVWNDARAATAVHCAVALPGPPGTPNDALADLVAALRDQATQPLHVWLLDHGRESAIGHQIAERVPDVAFSRVPVRKVPVPELLAPDLLPDVDRVVLARLGATLAGDELDADLGGHAAAARTLAGESGFDVINFAANRLDTADAAAELRRGAYARHSFDFDAFSDEVLVLDLERLRRDGFRRLALGLTERFRLRRREVLHYVLGPGRAQLRMP